MAVSPTQQRAVTLADILSLQRTACETLPLSRKQVLEKISHLLAPGLPGIQVQEIYHNLLARERLGSTSLGHGIALPHTRLKDVHGITGALLRLDHPISFDALDEQPVDLFFALVTPEDATEIHLQLLATLAERLKQEPIREALRSAHDQETLFRRVLNV